MDLDLLRVDLSIIVFPAPSVFCGGSIISEKTSSTPPSSRQMYKGIKLKDKGCFVRIIIIVGGKYVIFMRYVMQ